MAAFNEALHTYGHEGEDAATWTEAFGYLAELLKKKAQEKERVVVFIDELPCFDTPRSGFVKALDYFWNSKGAWIRNIFFVVCGSATSWMIRNVVDNKGGLHNRITHEMHLEPFSLHQTEEYLRSRGAQWDRLAITQLYMAIGGIPYYLSLLDYEESVAENIDRLFFAKNAELKKEYRRLFKSLYRNAQAYMDIVTLLAKHKEGMSRSEIAKALKVESNGELSTKLEDLVNCDFLMQLRNGAGAKTNGIYRLVDFYTLFYHQFCTQGTTDIHYWRNHLGTPQLNTWYGHAFERVCLCHIEEIRQALHLDTIYVEYYSWRSKTSPRGAQVDLILDRADGNVSVCEIKYSQGLYELDRDEYEKVVRRLDTFLSESGVNKGAQIVFITTFGLKPHRYPEIQKRVPTLDHLFAPLDEE